MPLLTFTQLAIGDTASIENCCDFFHHITPSETYTTAGQAKAYLLTERMKQTKRNPTGTPHGIKEEPVFELWMGRDGGNDILAVALDRTMKRVDHQDKDSPCQRDLWCITVGINKNADPARFKTGQVYPELKDFLKSSIQDSKRTLGLVWRGDVIKLIPGADDTTTPDKPEYADGLFSLLLDDVAIDNIILHRASDGKRYTSAADLLPEPAYRHFTKMTQATTHLHVWQMRIA